jgi:3-oxoacyl-(acyl-carrier-protein) reductase
MLDGKVALVTGGSRGIGKEIAIELARQGAYVIVNFSGNEDAAKEVVEQINKNGGNGEIYQCNVGNFEAVKDMIDTIVVNHKTIDIIVNNAGITKDNLLLKMTEQDFDEVININLKSVFNTSKHAVRYMMKQRSGKIINISSIVGIIGNAGQVNYGASKAGIIGMTKSLARELATRGITVNAVAPGFIETDMTASLSETVISTMLSNIPMKKFGQPNDIAKTVAFLASDSADYITGQVIQVNGGMNM